MTEAKHPLKVFLCHAHIIPLWDADRDSVKALYARLTKNIRKRTPHGLADTSGQVRSNP